MTASKGPLRTESDLVAVINTRLALYLEARRRGYTQTALAHLASVENNLAVLMAQFGTGHASPRTFINLDRDGCVTRDTTEHVI